MKVIAGLGNPGARYETTRHNVGFLAIDRLADAWKAGGPSQGFDAEVYNATVAGEKVLLVKPQTFMNNSGKSIGPIFKFYKLAPEDLVIIHDEVDLKPLALRIKTGGGTAGHNGLRSIDAFLGAEANGYHRIRIGVGKPLPQISGRGKTADHVLEPFTDDELSALDPVLDRVVAASERILSGDAQGAMTEFNVREPAAEKEGN